MGNLYYSPHLTGCIQKVQQCTQIHNKIQVYKTYCAESLFLKFYHSEFKIHNVSQAVNWYCRPASLWLELQKNIVPKLLD